MDQRVNEDNNVINLFGVTDSYNLIDLLTLKAIINRSKAGGASVSVSDISNRVLTFYWHLNFEIGNSHLVIHNFNDLRGKLISKYGLSLESSEDEILQILNYIQDKNTKITLFGTIKSSLSILSQIGKSKTENQIQAKFGLIGKHFFKVKSGAIIEIDPTWHYVIVNNYSAIINEIDKMILLLLYPESKIKVDRFEDQKKLNNKSIQTSDFKKEFKVLYSVEKRMSLQMNLNKKQYTCLEEALYWLDMDIDLFKSTQDLFIKFIRNSSFKLVTRELPLLTVAMLLFSAVYLYNDDESGGFWNGFFGLGTEYNYQRDVQLVMNCLEFMVKEYAIDTAARHYMEKRNLSEIFSHIYLPEISLKKIFSAIYSYYFRNRNRHLINKSEFLEVNQYRLDKPGLFFLGEDEILKNVFDAIIELIDDGVKDRNIRRDENLPKRFYDAFDSWFLNEKKELDRSREEYYISNPNIELDCINEGISLYLPKQKSRTYSDETCGWEITVDNNKSFVQGRIIRQQSGTYMVLDEKIHINDFRNLKVTYIFNNKKQGEWFFNNDKDFLIFDKNLIYQKKSFVKRGICYLGFSNKFEIDHECVIERYEIQGWKDYIIYSLDFSEYLGKEFLIDHLIKLNIEDEPVVKRINFKFLFEKWEVEPLFETINIYEFIGTLILTSPFIEMKDIQVYYYDSNFGKDVSEFLCLERISSNKIQLIFNENIPSGSYNLTVKYKNRICFREGFIVDHETKVFIGDIESYERLSSAARKIEIEAGDNVEFFSDDYDTRIERTREGYSIETITGSIAKFIYKTGRTEVPIRKIVKPIKFEIVGLDDLLEMRESEKTKEITKEVFANNSTGLYVKNLDGRHDYLVYELLLIDEVSDDYITNIKKLKLGEDSSWDFKVLSDRIIDFKNIKIVLNVKDKDHTLLFSTTVLHVIEYVRIHEMGKKIIDNIMTISWKENQVNKCRKVILYNITAPREQAHEYEIDDDVTKFEVDLNSLSCGAYAMVVGFRKEQSLFDSMEIKIKFFEREKIEDYFINKQGPRKSKGYEKLIKCIWMMFKEKYDALDDFFLENNLESVEAFDVFVALIQMKYLADNGKGVSSLLKVTYKLLKNQMRINDINSMVSILLEHKNELAKKDLIYIITAILSLGLPSNLSEEIIDELAEIDLVSALCAVENGSSSLSRNLVMKCKESFDAKLLTPGIIRNHEAIYEIIYDEATMINDFWSWLIEHRNNYLLKYDYSKARLFRMYEVEKDLSTNRVGGRTIDDMVDNLVNSQQSLQANIPTRWYEQLMVEKDVYDAFIKMINDSRLNAYKDILCSAFISVSKLPVLSDEELFDLSMRCQLSNRSEIYNRYRAYLKLIFL